MPDSPIRIKIARIRPFTFQHNVDSIRIQPLILGGENSYTSVLALEEFDSVGEFLAEN